ncbi:MAG: hypothetical protein ACOVNU_05825 [Candidatus Kapaibacteriota bacterium]
MAQTLEEAAETEFFYEYGKETSVTDGKREAFIEGAKWQQEQEKRRYSDEEVLKILDMFLESILKGEITGLTEKWFEQFKKK